MPHCFAKGCKNSSKNGAKMNYFPRDPQRRESWKICCTTLGGMDEGSLLHNSSALCEYHFSADKWEKTRVDGTKKLKVTATPTIFGELVYQTTVKIPQEPIRMKNNGSEMIMVHTDPVTKEVTLLSPVRKRKIESYPVSVISNSKTSEIQGEMSKGTEETNSIQDTEEKELTDSYAGFKSIDETNSLLEKYEKYICMKLGERWDS